METYLEISPRGTAKTWRLINAARNWIIDDGPFVCGSKKRRVAVIHGSRNEQDHIVNNFSNSLKRLHNKGDVILWTKDFVEDPKKVYRHFYDEFDYLSVDEVVPRVGDYYVTTARFLRERETVKDDIIFKIFELAGRIITYPCLDCTVLKTEELKKSLTEEQYNREILGMWYK